MKKMYQRPHVREVILQSSRLLISGSYGVNDYGKKESQTIGGDEPEVKENRSNWDEWD